MILTRQEKARSKYARRQNRAPGRDLKLNPDLLPELLAKAESSNAEARCQAARELCPCHVQGNVPEIWDRLLTLVHDPDVRVRKAVFHTLADGSPNEREAEVVAALESMYQDPDPGLRRHVRRLLAAYRRCGRINIL